MSLFPLTSITLDPELQPRAEIDRTVLENYVQLLVDGAKFPPVMVFRTDDELLLADGFHRWHAHKALELDQIAVEIVDGTRRDALLYSLSANAKHGLPRGTRDYGRAYEIAVRNGLVAATDSEAVAALLGCSVSWGEKLTRAAREAETVARNAAILAAREAGQSNRAIARETGLSRQTVDRVVSGPKADSADLGHCPEPTPIVSGSAKEKLDELFSQPALSWSSALRALRIINEQPSIDKLFAERFHGFDHVFSPELMAAFTWITALHERFYDERDQRRSA